MSDKKTCFFCPINNQRQCEGSCGLCGDACPGAEPPKEAK